MKYKNLIGQIDSDINTNGERGITGETLNSVLNAMVSVLGDGYRIAGVVLADAVPPEQAENGMCYIAGEEGTYANFGNVTVRNDELALIYHNGTQWVKMSVPCRTFGYVEIHSDYTSLAWYEMNELRKDFAIIFDVRTNKKDVYYKCNHWIDANGHDFISFRTLPNINISISSDAFSFDMKAVTVEYMQGLDGYVARLDDESYSKDIYDAQTVDWLLSRKQGVLSFDSAPTAGSTNPVTSDGINEALGGYYTKTQTDNLLSAKQNTLTFDNAPTSGSKNPVTSNGIKEAIDRVSMPRGGTTGQVLAKASDLSFDTEWVDQSGGGGVTDVTVGGVSVVTQGVAAVPAIPDTTDFIEKSQTAGFVKNDGTIDTTQYGTYSKPSGGIPSTDLASAVQTSLGKADTALQSYTETDPVFSASAAAGITSSDIAEWDGKAEPTPVVDASTIPSSMEPNKLYKYGTLSGNTVFPPFATPTDQTIANVYWWKFTTPSTAPNITWPAGITEWAGGQALNIDASTTYEITVEDGFAAYIKS